MAQAIGARKGPFPFVSEELLSEHPATLLVILFFENFDYSFAEGCDISFKKSVLVKDLVSTRMRQQVG